MVKIQIKLQLFIIDTTQVETMYGNRPGVLLIRALN